MASTQQPLSPEALPSPLSSRPERTRISCLAPLNKTARAPFFKERRILFASATNFYRKSGGAERRDLCVDASSWKCFSTERSRGICSCTSPLTDVLVSKPKPYRTPIARPNEDLLTPPTCVCGWDARRGNKILRYRNRQRSICLRGFLQ